MRRAGARTVRRFLRMTPAAALYLQRGIPVLHAAVAVDADGRAVVLAGDSGSGKSVLLGALLRRGWGLLTDDLAPVALDSNHVPVALPTWPQIRPWPGHAGPTGLAAGLGAGLAAEGDRGLDRAFVREPRPIGAIWWLGVHGCDRVETRAVEGLARFDAFGAMAYNRLIADALLDRARYLAVAGAVAGAALPIRRAVQAAGPVDGRRARAPGLRRLPGLISGTGRHRVLAGTVFEPAQVPPHHQAPLEDEGVVEQLLRPACRRLIDAVREPTHPWQVKHRPGQLASLEGG